MRGDEARAGAPAAVRVAVVRAVRAVSPAERGDHSNGQLGRRRVEHLADEIGSSVIPSEQRRREREHRGECCGQRVASVASARSPGAAVPRVGRNPGTSPLGNGASLRR